MKKTLTILTIFSLTLMLVPAVLATNGTNLIGIGPISRAMGGGGVAAPQDAISAIFANPAAMCFGPYCPNSSVDFAGTWFSPSVDGKVDSPMGTMEGESKFDPFVIPAVGVTSPINESLRFGIGLYGISGLGTDYRGTSLGSAPDNKIYTQLQTMKFAPNLAWLVTNDFSLGLSLEVVWQSLDLGYGASHGYALGAQLGALYHLDKFNFGISYITPEKVKHDNVLVPPNGPSANTFNDLEIESPQTVKLGVSFEPNQAWLFEFNTRWYDWSGTAGYGDFGWDDQWVFVIGGQWKATDKWTFRLGYNYGKSPIKENNGFNPGGITDVQGVPIVTGDYEALRIVGFPAIVEQHFTAGMGYKLTDNWIVNLSFMYAPEETVTVTTNTPGGPLTYEASLKEWSSTFGLTWYF